MIAAALLLAAALGPQEEACRAALELAYDGSTGAALARFAEAQAARPEPLCRYLELLARAWTIEQSGNGADQDAEFHRRVDELLAGADQRLRADPQDGRARLLRGAAHGLHSRLHLFRWERRAAAREAARMREDLLEVPESEPLRAEARFGLGLYDYYADVLPRLFKLVRFLMGLPGGDRAHGLQALEAAGGQEALLHRTEAQAQLFDIYVYYEGRDDDALREARELRQRYPGNPLWGLRLAEHLRARLGLYAESAALAGEIRTAAEGGRPNYGPVVAGLGRVLEAEAWLLDLQPPARAREAAQAALAAPLPAAWRARAELALGQALERLGQRAAAEPRFRAAARDGDEPVRQRAERALEQPLGAREGEALRLLGEARRLRAAGAAGPSRELYRKALGLQPESCEARLRVAEEDLLSGRLEPARRRLEALLDEETPEPPWVVPWARLLSARLDDLAGRRAAALQGYNQVFKRPLGSPELKALAGEGLRQPWAPEAVVGPEPRRRNHPN